MKKYLYYIVIAAVSVLFFLVINHSVLAQDDATTTPEGETSAPSTQALGSEPVIRVGLYKTLDDVHYISTDPHDIYAGAQWQGVLMGGALAILGYHDGTYTFVSDNLTFTSDQPIRLIPSSADIYFTLPNITRKLSGRKSNYNAYRGTFEYRYAPMSKIPYLINELPLEYYTAGIAETADSAPTEFLKALQTAARTYGYTAITGKPISSKHLFDVFATTQDQLYLGYNSEIEMPRTASSTRATAGQLVAYNDTPITTYYFSHSNGKTKTAKPARPWLVSVVAKYDKGLKQSGHGVGMSARDAMMRAKKDGWKYDQILGYYYTSTTIKQAY